jgi:hypothetical protein
VPALKSRNRCHSENYFRKTIRCLKPKTSLGVLLATQWPEFELIGLGKLLRQEVLQFAGFYQKVSTI